MKTAVVTVEERWQHPLYKKTIKKTKKYLADNQIEAKDGDTVLIASCRPISKRKSWFVQSIIAKNN